MEPEWRPSRARAFVFEAAGLGLMLVLIAIINLAAPVIGGWINHGVAVACRAVGIPIP